MRRVDACLWDLSLWARPLQEFYNTDIPVNTELLNPRAGIYFKKDGGHRTYKKLEIFFLNDFRQM